MVRAVFAATWRAHERAGQGRDHPRDACQKGRDVHGDDIFDRQCRAVAVDVPADGQVGDVAAALLPALSAPTARLDPQCLHFKATTRISSPQNWHAFLSLICFLL